MQKQRVIYGIGLMIVAAGLVASCGGDSKSAGPSGVWPDPVSTGVGAPTGPLATATIGAAGGNLATTDNRVRIQIPNGALAGDTQIGIQMITGGAPSTVGQAFRFTPDGLTFSAPVTVTLAYEDTDIGNSAPGLLTIGTQQANGSWELYDSRNLEVDTVAKTISFTTLHFSDYTLLRGLQIRPPGDTIDEGESVQLEVLNCTTVVETSTETHSSFAYDCRPNVPPPGPNEDDLPALPVGRVDGASWAANGVRGGSAAVGFVAGNRTAEYVAPATAPAGNPVAVSVKVTLSDNSVWTLVSSIKIRNSCESNVPGVAALRDPCRPPNLFGTSQSTITDATPLYRIEANIEWVYDSLRSVPGSVAQFNPKGSARFISLDPCIEISPDSFTWDVGYEHASGTIQIMTIGPDSTWTGFGGVLWTATYTDLCDEHDEPSEGAVGGAYFAGNGDFNGSYVFQGTRSIGGQTFSYSFSPASSTAPKPMSRAR